MQIKLEDEQIQNALNAAILVAVGETGKEAIVKEAVRYLTSQDRGSYGNNPSPLQAALRETSRTIATAVLTERLTHDKEFLASVESLFVEAVRKMLNVENREKLVTRLAEAMAKGISEDRY